MLDERLLPIGMQPPFELRAEVFRVLRAVYLAANLADLLAAHPDDVKQSLAENIELGLKVTGDEVARAYRERAVIFEHMARLLASHDVLALPTVQVTPFPIEQEWVTSIDGVPQATYIDWLRSCSRITVSAHPAVTVPAGFTRDGLPVGLQLVGQAGADWRLLEIAGEIERALGASDRRPEGRSWC